MDCLNLGLEYTGEPLTPERLNRDDYTLVFGKGRSSEGLSTPCIDSADMPMALPGETVLVATAPVHYDEVLETLEHLRYPPKKVIFPFSVGHPLKVDVIVESQPRSGTHYVMRHKFLH